MNSTEATMFNFLDRSVFNLYTRFGSAMLTLLSLALTSLFAYGYFFAENIAKPGMTDSVRFGGALYSVFGLVLVAVHGHNFCMRLIRGSVPPEERPYDYRPKNFYFTGGVGTGAYTRTHRAKPW